jgi:hypothetical protein
MSQGHIDGLMLYNICQSMSVLYTVDYVCTVYMHMSMSCMSYLILYISCEVLYICVLFFLFNLIIFYCIYKYTSIHLHQQNYTIYKRIGPKVFYNIIVGPSLLFSYIPSIHHFIHLLVYSFLYSSINKVCTNYWYGPQF